MTRRLEDSVRSTLPRSVVLAYSNSLLMALAILSGWEEKHFRRSGLEPLEPEGVEDGGQILFDSAAVRAVFVEHGLAV